MKIDIAQPPHELLKQVTSNRLERLHERDNSVIGEVASRYSLNSGKAIIKSEIHRYRENNFIGINGIIKMRTGTFLFTKDLVRLLVLPASYKQKCICCNKNTAENLEHILLRCERFSEIRERYFPKLVGKVDSMDETLLIKTISKLLGGEGPASGRKLSRKVHKTIEYLSRVLPKRSEIISGCKGRV